jgi:6-phosphogluconolactonase
LAVSGLANCGGSGTTVPPPPPAPAPAVSSISPDSAIAGAAAFTLTINGSNFVAASMVNFAGTSLTTTYVSATQLTAAIPASSIVSAGTPAVTVINPAPGGGSSNPIDFTVLAAGAVPAISIIFPSCAPAGEPVQLTVVGTNFETGSVVRWNGSDRPTSGNGSINAVVAQISASDVAMAGTAVVTVFNPGNGGGSSGPSTFTITAGAVYPLSIALDPAGKFAYVASMGCGGGTGGYVSMYTINPTSGALTSAGLPLPTNDEATASVTVDPMGKFVYVASAGNVWDIDFGSVLAFSINSTTGALTPTTGGIIGSGVNGTPEYFNFVALDPSGKFAYAADGGDFPPGGAGDDSVSMFTVNSSTGAMTPTGMIAAGTGPDAVTVDPAGKFAYVMNYASNNISMYSINAASGALTSTGTIAAGTNPFSMVVHPTGQFAYVANSGSNDLSLYTRNATTGVLTSAGTIATGTEPVAVVVDPAGKFAYVTNFNSNDVSMYSINGTTGALTSMGTIAAGSNPTWMAMHPSGKFLYVANADSNNVSMYSIDAGTGALTLIGTIGT